MKAELGNGRLSIVQFVASSAKPCEMSLIKDHPFAAVIRSLACANHRTKVRLSDRNRDCSQASRIALKMASLKRFFTLAIFMVVAIQWVECQGNDGLANLQSALELLIDEIDDLTDQLRSALIGPNSAPSNPAFPLAHSPGKIVGSVLRDLLGTSVSTIQTAAGDLGNVLDAAGSDSQCLIRGPNVNALMNAVVRLANTLAGVSVTTGLN